MQDGAVIERLPVRISDPDGASPYVFICEHASNRLPARFGTLGLSPGEMDSHIAWDPGALPVARTLAAALSASLVESTVSRLVIDCNRPLDAPDLIQDLSETIIVAGNANLSPGERASRIALSWQPFHDAVCDLIDRRLKAGRETRLVSIHSFTPIYKGVARPWQIGVLHDDDTRLSAPMIAALEAQGELTVGDNQPYSPADRVYFTLERHARSRGLPCAMIEIRNDEIRDAAGQSRWAELLGGIFLHLEPGRHGQPARRQRAGS